MRPRHEHEPTALVLVRRDPTVGFVAFLWQCHCGTAWPETLDDPAVPRFPHAGDT